MLIGQRFGRLVVVGLIPDRKNPKAMCRCDCGEIVSPQRGALRNGRAKSCGCLRRELLVLAARRPKKTAEEKRKRFIEWQRKYAEANREKFRERSRLFHQRHPERTRENCRARRARKKMAVGVVSPGIERTLLKRQRWKCACCNVSLRNAGFELDHVVPLARGGKHEDANLQMLCPPCNKSKGARDPIEFMQSRGALL